MLQLQLRAGLRTKRSNAAGGVRLSPPISAVRGPRWVRGATRQRRSRAIKYFYVTNNERVSVKYIGCVCASAPFALPCVRAGVRVSVRVLSSKMLKEIEEYEEKVR